MTLSRVTTGNQNSISAGLQGLHYVKRINSSCAGNADNSYIRWILNSTDARQIGAGISTPVAEDGNNFGFPIFSCQILSHTFSIFGLTCPAVFLTYILDLRQYLFIVKSV